MAEERAAVFTHRNASVPYRCPPSLLIHSLSHAMTAHAQRACATMQCRWMTAALQLSSRAEAALRLRFANQSPDVLRRLLHANALAEHCILPDRERQQSPPGTAAASNTASGAGDVSGGDRVSESAGAERTFEGRVVNGWVI